MTSDGTQDTFAIRYEIRTLTEICFNWLLGYPSGGGKGSQPRYKQSKGGTVITAGGGEVTGPHLVPNDPAGEVAFLPLGNRSTSSH